MNRLSVSQLTALQVGVAYEAYGFPAIVKGVRINIARRLEEKGWGTVEEGMNGDRLFRLNQDGENAIKRLISNVKA